MTTQTLKAIIQLIEIIYHQVVLRSKQLIKKENVRARTNTIANYKITRACLSVGQRHARRNNREGVSNRSQARIRRWLVLEGSREC